ncbi:OmpP1/FadL family transporter [Hufsiella ginkgonis]|uniref:Aromatic hydrocarbon degradation protein n=1 Tax=Hufsiella ginkgonis TaxID=2695274 RepID=A0A7K1XWF5_9SPHI|nr:hypothetical protein [Hufsiella ginkgonis]MXV15290.1 hypothetical protein [Hufsiella ginkgonis]
MKLKNILLLTGMVLPLGNAFAQYTSDLLRFSQTQQGVTARFRAMGSAQTALGGDLSSLSGNPAGLGMFTRNDLSLTTDFSSVTANSTYLATSTSAQKEKLGFNQAGAVFHLAIPRPRGSDLTRGWLGLNFGIGYNRTNNFNLDNRYGGTNTRSTFADFIAGSAAGYSGPSALADESLEGMAYDSFLIDYSNGFFATTNTPNSQLSSSFYTGGQSELNLAVGANYSNQLYIGGSISLTSINFTADKEFTESGKTAPYATQPAQLIGAGYRLDYHSSQVTDGSGINAKLGLIYRASPAVRLGLNFVSPTWYTVDDDYAEGIETRYTPATGSAYAPYTYNDADYPSSYSFRSPYKVSGGISVVVGGTGLITGDAEYVDYSSIHFSSDDRPTTTFMNKDIKNAFQPATNFRVGGELKISSLTMLRAGYNTAGNPYKEADYSSEIISAGIGYRKNNFYADFTYANSTTRYNTRPYVISQDLSYYNQTGPGEAADIEEKRNNFYVTFGIRFK